MNSGDPLVERLRWQLGPGTVDGPLADERCRVRVDGTATAARALRLLADAGVPVVIEGEPAAGAAVLTVERMNALLGLDAESGVAHVQAGCTWRRVEWLLRRRGLTLGPLPAWLLERTVLESFATNDRLRPSPRYGQLTDGALAFAAVLPRGGIARSSVAPRRSTGPDLGRVPVGARHRGGLLTEVHLQAWPAPEARAWRAIERPDWSSALAAAVAVLRAGVQPAWWRLDRPRPRGPVRIWASLVETAGNERPATRFDAVVGGAGIDAAEVEAAAAALFPPVSPDAPRAATTPAFGTVAWAPRATLPAVAAAVEGAEVWDVAPEGGTVYAPAPLDELQVRRLRDLGAHIDTGGDEGGDEWQPLAEAVFARLAPRTSSE